MDVTKPFLVVAGRELLDPNFARTVVLMVNHDEEGSFGLVLNRPLGRHLVDVLPEIDPRAAAVPLFQGGPVQTDMVQFLSRQGPEQHRVGAGLCVGAGLEDLLGEQAVDDGIRAYAGYAGWSAGQLERETAEGSWIIAPLEARHVFDVPSEDLWEEVLRGLGGGYAWMTLGGGSQN